MHIVIGTFFGTIISSIFIFYLLEYPKSIPVVQALGSIGILFSASIALSGYILNLKSKKDELSKDKSKTNLDLSLEFLKHSFETLSNRDETKAPINDRIIWLTCARQILTAQEISEKITEIEHKDIYFEYKNFWQTKFYTYLEQHKDKMNKGYFSDKAEYTLSTPIEVRQPLSGKSLAVIFRFIVLQDDKNDKIKNIKDFTNEEIKQHLTFKFNGLAEYLNESRVYLENIKNKTKI